MDRDVRLTEKSVARFGRDSEEVQKVGILIVVLTIGGVAALATSALVSSPRRPEPAETSPLRLARWLERHPGFAAFVARRLDRSSAGGLLLTLGAVGMVALGASVGVLLDMADEESGFGSFDMSVAEFGVDNQDSLTAELARFMTHLGGTRVIFVVTVLVAIWGWWRYRNLQIALFMITVSVGQALVNNGLKWAVERERPDLAQLVPWSGSSFPSGHSVAATATYLGAAYVLTLHSSRRPKAFAFGIATFVSVSVAATRAVLGVHWLTDVIAGVAVGLAWFLFCVAVFGGRMMTLGEPIGAGPSDSGAGSK
jgi:membrane-associated phospholipid phosphatase